jgi:glycogen debranching enzyme
VPHRPRDCPFQAWSLADLLRLDLVVLTESWRSNFRVPVEKLTAALRT